MMPHTLFQAATAAMAQSHSPYSEFPVGAALRTDLTIEYLRHPGDEEIPTVRGDFDRILQGPINLSNGVRLLLPVTEDDFTDDGTTATP